MKKYKTKEMTLKICLNNSSSTLKTSKMLILVIFYNTLTVLEPDLLVLFALINS